MNIRKLLLILIIPALLVTGCGSSDGDSSSDGGSSDPLLRSIINNYVDNVVIPTYLLLRNRATVLREAVEELEENPTQDNLETARDVWIASRIPWEQSEAWLFGPVDTNGYDPALDSWPVNRTDLDAVLASSDPLTEQFVSNLDPTLKGFHTVEYLLFDFTVGELGQREFDYLIATANDIESTAIDLYESWAEGPDPYGELFKDAGNNNVYPSQESAIEQMIIGMSIILDEVANGKIADPYDEQDTTLVESQFSFNSLDDFSNDILGVLYVYLGDQETVGTSGPGIDELVAQSDPQLAQDVEDNIIEAITLIGEIPPPFRDAILDPNASDEIEAAQAALNDVFNQLQEDVLPLIH